MSRIDVLGPVPPPFGGVSIHVVRYVELLRAAGHCPRVLPYTGTMRTGRPGKTFDAVARLAALHLRSLGRRPDVMHLHYGGLGYLLAAGWLLRRPRVRKVVTFHSVRVLRDLEAATVVRRRRVLDLLGGCDLFVAVRGEIGEALHGLGLTGPDITIMPAFLPPAAAETRPDRLPSDVESRLRGYVGAGRRQLCCGAYYLGEGYGHRDIYGVEDLVAALDLLDGREGPAADLWVLVSNAPGSAEQRSIRDRLVATASRWQRFRLELHFGLPLVPVLAQSHAFLRPSREDGDSVAVREALSLGIPVLASDVVARPQGVVLCRLDGPAALARSVAGVLEWGGTRGGAVAERDTNDVYEAFVRKVVGE